MRAVLKTVYYCDFCKREHRMTAASMEKHEPRCIYNPDRSVCGWHVAGARIERPGDYVAEFTENLDADWLREKLDGCPSCMLAVVVQAGMSSMDRELCGFDYSTEVARFREQEQRYAGREF